MPLVPFGRTTRRTNRNLQGDKIYMFGFSRGAFTAKFLARMIHTVGLLCKGNEEMVPFAYRLYQRYLAGDVQEYQMGRQGQGRRRKQNQDAAAAGATTNGVDPVSPAPTETVPSVSTAVASGVDGTTPGLPTDPSQANSARESEHHNRDEITAFSNTFCRKEQVIRKGRVEEQNIKVYFLGMWDCVNSVAVLERKTPIPVPVKGTAEYVRHAVAVDERRVKFKAALLAQDIRYRKEHDEATVENIKEIWFPGCHGDVGGGWPATTNNPLDTREKMTIWQRIKNAWTTRKAEKNAATRYMDSGPFQMSDIPLAWMIRELELIGEKEPNAALKWKPELLDRFKKRYGRKKGQALKGLIHDSLAFGYGTGFMKVLFWKFMGECTASLNVINVTHQRANERQNGFRP